MKLLTAVAPAQHLFTSTKSWQLIPYAKNLGKLDNHRQEPWKAPLPVFIEELYRKRFGKSRPEQVLTIEERAALEMAKRTAKKEAKRLREDGGQRQLEPGEE